MSRKPKVLLIGWDSADWRIIRPLLADGKLPGIASIMQKGVHGNLATIQPVLSPMLWTSIATGKRPFKHGVLGFYELDPDNGGIRLVSTASRKVKAIWNILNQNGFKSNVVGWWPSYPAEPISGVMVSDRFHLHADADPDKAWPIPEHTVHPAAMAEKLADMRLHPQEVTGEMLAHFIPRIRDIEDKQLPTTQVLFNLIAQAATYQATATRLIQHTEWDFMAVYFEFLDILKHNFMSFHPPKLASVSDESFELYKDVITNGYQFQDAMLQVMLKLIDDDTTVIVMSDHGFHPDHMRLPFIPLEPAGIANEHRSLGIIAMRGPQLLENDEVFGSSVLDIAPTVLQLFGLPIAQDMDGKPLLQAFKPECSKAETIPSWEDVEGEDGQLEASVRVNPAEAAEAMRQLIDLGYIEDYGDDKKAAEENLKLENNFNKAGSLKDAGKIQEAMAIYDELFQQYPMQQRIAAKLFACCLELGHTARCHELLEHIHKNNESRREMARADLKKLEELESQGPLSKQLLSHKYLILRVLHDNPYKENMLRGSVYMAEKNFAKAREEFEHVLEMKFVSPFIFNSLGKCLLELNEITKAEAAFQRALAMDDDNVASYYGMARVRFVQENYTQAAEFALHAIDRRFNFPMCHHLLGISLMHIGDYSHAEDALKLTVHQAPNFPQGHETLAKLYLRINQNNLAEKHLELARLAKERVKQID